VWYLRFELGGKTWNPRTVVNGVLQGRLKGKRGHAHNTAVLLGLKEGVLNRGDDEA